MRTEGIVEIFHDVIHRGREVALVSIIVLNVQLSRLLSQVRSAPSSSLLEEQVISSPSPIVVRCFLFLPLCGLGVLLYSVRLTTLFDDRRTFTLTGASLRVI